MESAIAVLQWTSSLALFALAALVVRRWLRRPDQAGGFIALAVGSLGLVSVVGRVNVITAYRYPFLADFSLVGFVVSGYALLLFRDRFLRMSRTVLWAAAALGAAVTVLALAVRLPSGPNPEYTTVQFAVISALIVVWCGFVMEPMIRFWRASRGRPSVQRARLRSMAAGYGLLVAILLIAVGSVGTAGTHPSVTLVTQMVVLAIVPLLYASFEAPPWIRPIWRAGEEDALGWAMHDLLASRDQAELARTSLDWALRLVGGDAGFVRGPDGLLAVVGMTAEEASELTEGMLTDGRPRLAPSATGDRWSIITPLRIGSDFGCIAVMSGPLTPFFGTDEAERLRAFAASVATALDRAGLMEALQESESRTRLIVETANDAYISMDDGGRITDWNRRAEELFGWTRVEALGRTVAETLVPERYRDAHLAGLAKFLRTGEGAVMNAPLEIEALRRDGREVFVELTIWAIQADEGYVFNAFVRDIGDRRRAAEAMGRLASLVESADDAIIGKTLDGEITSWNPAAERIYGYTATEAVGSSIGMLVPEGHEDEIASLFARIRAGEAITHHETIRRRKDGGIINVSLTISPVTTASGEIVGAATISRDVTERARVQATLDLLRRIAQSSNEAVDVEAAMQEAVHAVAAYTGWPIGHAYLRGDDGRLHSTAVWHVSDPARFDGFVSYTHSTFVPEDGLPGVVANGGRPVWIADVSREASFLRRERAAAVGLGAGFAFPVLTGADVAGVLEFYAGSPAPPDERLLEVVVQIGTQLGRVFERRRAADAQARSERGLFEFLEGIPVGVFIADASGTPYYANLAAQQILGQGVDRRLTPADLARHYAAYRSGTDELYPTERLPITRALAGEESYIDDQEIRRPDRAVPIEAWGRPIFDDAGNIQYAIVAFADISERRRVERELSSRAEELARSNAELEQFAYVASHDLQEPLRMITGYVQLLARRYEGKLDADADEFIHYAVDGADRMRELINDLLAYARVDSRGDEMGPTPLDDVARAAVVGMQPRIEESGASVSCDDLPVVVADRTQMGQLMQNLIGNALKFVAGHPAEVRVGADRRDGEWVVWVKDNGIGIDPKFNERIFQIFQRLHTRTSYPGTGIGLAICRKIVERHGGRIWVESLPGAGSTFSFTLPDRKGVPG